MNEADAIYVADTGSTDNTIKLLEEKGVIVNSITVNPWRFDTARNMSLELVPEDVDICVCTDLDEVFDKGWRKKLESKWQPYTTRARYDYIWKFDKYNNPEVNFWIEKIHSRKNFCWEHPVHEVLKYTGNNDSYITCDDITLKHYPDNSKSRGQYLPLLEMSIKEAPNDDRNMHYLGREYMYYGRYDDAISTLKKHLDMPSATWLDERCASMRFIARSYKALGDLQKAESWLYRAIAEAPYLREPYLEMADIAYKEKDWLKTYYFVNEALKIKEKPKSYINENYCWGSLPYDVGSICAYNLGLTNDAIRLAEIAYSLNQDERIKSNIDIMKKNQGD